MHKALICEEEFIHRESVALVKSSMLEEELFDQLIDFYKLIADRTRCKILFAIDQQEMCVCDIAEVLGLSKSLVSHQLKLLKEKHLVRSRKSGREVYYQLDDSHVRDVFEIVISHVKEK